MLPSDSPEVLARFQSELGFVNAAAGQIRREVGDLLELQEMISFGQEGLLMAARRYDPSRGISFRKYAYYRVRGAIIDGVRTNAPLSRRAREKVRALQAANLVSSGFFEDASDPSHRLAPQAADGRLADHLAVLATAMAVGIAGNESCQQNGERVIVSEERPDAKVERDELMEIVHKELAGLSDTEATFIRRHFLRDENVEDIAAGMGLSKSWGSRVLSRGIAKLSKRLQAAS